MSSPSEYAACDEAIRALQAALATAVVGRVRQPITPEWIEEALEQLKERDMK